MAITADLIDGRTTIGGGGVDCTEYQSNDDDSSFHFDFLVFLYKIINGVRFML